MKINEIFGPTVQGEGLVIGQKTLFIRVALCDYSCKFCDTKYAVDVNNPNFSFKEMTEEEILQELLRLNCKNVTISGGNPALYDLTNLINLLHTNGFFINIETQGSIPRKYFEIIDLVTLSPKPPSSGMTTDWKKLDDSIKYCKNYVLKIVVSDDADFEYAKEVCRRYPNSEVIFQVCNDVGKDTLQMLVNKLASLVERVVKDNTLQRVRVLPQMHVLLYGNRRGI